MYLAKYDAIVGRDLFWNISLTPQADQSVLPELQTLLSMVYIRKTPKSLDSRLKVWQTFADRCLEGITMSQAP